MTYHPYINRDAFDHDSSPGRTDRILATLKREEAVILSEPRDSLNGRVAAKNAAMLEELLEASKRNDRARDQLHAEIAAKKKAEIDAVEESRRTALVDSLRAAYLAHPGVSEADFEEALHGLLKRRAEDAALQSETELDRQMAAAKATGKYSI